jgi:putative oxidoreductase
MFYQLVETSDDRIPMLARLALGIVMLPHGAHALLAASPEPSLGVFYWPALAAELVGGLALIIGFCARVAALGVAIHLIIAVIQRHWGVGLFMNWTGQQPGEGFEFHILAVTLAIVVIIRGSGALSLDRVLTTRRLAA